MIEVWREWNPGETRPSPQRPRELPDILTKSMRADDWWAKMEGPCLGNDRGHRYFGSRFLSDALF